MIWLLIACLLWGPSFGLIPMVLGPDGVNPYTLSVLRMVLSCALFVPLFRTGGLTFRRRLDLMGIGAVQFGVMYLALFLSYETLAGYEVALVTIFTPFYVSLLDSLASRRRPDWRPLGWVAVAVLGAGLIRYARIEHSRSFWIGFSVMQVSNLSFALGQVLYRRTMRDTEGLEDRHVFGWLYLGALAVCLASWLALGNPAEAVAGLPELPPRSWLIVLWLGLVPSGVAFFLFNHGALRVNAHTLAVVNNLKIPIALLIVLFLFGQREAIEHWPRFLAGAALLLGALWGSRRAPA